MFIDFLEGRVETDDINHTHIALIPKIAQLELVSQFRPTSLWNVIYKIASKVLTHRLKSILSSIIFENQSAFIPCRLISDNVVVVHEIIHFLHNIRQGKVGNFVFKLDMSKAYDSIEWAFVKGIM